MGAVTTVWGQAAGCGGGVGQGPALTALRVSETRTHRQWGSHSITMVPGYSQNKGQERGTNLSGSTNRGPQRAHGNALWDSAVHSEQKVPRVGAEQRLRLRECECRRGCSRACPSRRAQGARPLRIPGGSGQCCSVVEQCPRAPAFLERAGPRGPRTFPLLFKENEGCPFSLQLCMAGKRGRVSGFLIKSNVASKKNSRSHTVPAKQMHLDLTAILDKGT